MTKVGIVFCLLGLVLLFAPEIAQALNLGNGWRAAGVGTVLVGGFIWWAERNTDENKKGGAS